MANSSGLYISKPLRLKFRGLFALECFGLPVLLFLEYDAECGKRAVQALSCFVLLAILLSNAKPLNP